MERIEGIANDHIHSLAWNIQVSALQLQELFPSKNS